MVDATIIEIITQSITKFSYSLFPTKISDKKNQTIPTPKNKIKPNPKLISNLSNKTNFLNFSFVNKKE